MARGTGTTVRLALATGLVGLAGLGALALGGCAKKEKAAGPVAPARPEQLADPAVAMLASQFEDHKAQWNALLKSNDSPLPPQRIDTFPGIEFFPYDARWRFVGDLERLDPPQQIKLPDTKGTLQDYMEYGRYPFEVDGRTLTLTVYRPLEHSEQFFIAFMDSTTGAETYAGGRYVHLDSIDTHKFVLDLNKAYNPYCAYDTSWMCPLPPPQNRLAVAVRAGMRDAPHASDASHAHE